MRVVFLDYDGVVNTPMWSEDGKVCSFAHPEDNKVNNFQCVQWVSEFCQKYEYSIVVTSTWRFSNNYKECLINGGLRDGIKILGRTPHIYDGNRGDEIIKYLKNHPEIDDFLIIDDDCFDMEDCLLDRFVKCDSNAGFTATQMLRAERIHNNLIDKKIKGEQSDV